MPCDTSAVLAAVRAQPWAILPDYLAAIEAIALRALDHPALLTVAEDGHQARLAAGLSAIAATGTPLEGTRTAMLRDGVATIPVFGPIFPRATMLNSSAGGTALDAVMRDFRVAQGSPQVDAVVLAFDSPGGVVSGLGEAADAIRGAAKPVTSFVTGMAASAAYWLASQAREMVLDRAASVGSIGVVATVSRQEATDANGRRSYEVVSSGAPRKRPDVTSEDGRAAVQAEVDAIEQQFIADVAAGRRVSSGIVRSEFGRGGMVAAANAVGAGMADRISTLEATLQQLARRTAQTSPAGRRAWAAADLETRRRVAGME
jgi:ClpP class serine protease